MQHLTISTAYLLLCLLAVSLTFCTPSEDVYHINIFYSATEQDSLKADLITYIGHKPKNVQSLSRFNTKYRKYYLQFLPVYHFDRYYIDTDNTHYFYMLRPARSAKGNMQRGVGGKFRKNESGRITEFTEIFNTPILSEEELREKGRDLFSEMIKTGNLGKYTGNRDFIEWPDVRLKYDAATYEWRYVPLL